MTEGTKTALIIGGTRGIGGRIAYRLLQEGYQVVITGTAPPTNPALIANGWEQLQLHRPDLRSAITEFVNGLPEIDTLVYAAGFHQGKPLDQLTDDALGHMEDVGLTAPIAFIRDLLRRQGRISQVVYLTSTSQWTPRPHEAPCTAVKSGLAMFARSMAADGRIGQSIIIAPSATWTNFWIGVEDKDPAEMMAEERAGDLCVIIMSLRDHFVFAVPSRFDDNYRLLERYMTLALYLDGRQESV